MKIYIYMEFLGPECWRSTAQSKRDSADWPDSPPPSGVHRKKEVKDATNFLSAVFLRLTPIQWEQSFSVLVCWVLLEFCILLPSCQF